MAQEQFGTQLATLGMVIRYPIFGKIDFLLFTRARNSQYFKRYEQKTDFFTHFWVLEGSLAAQLVSKVVGNGLETYFLTFGAHRHPLWTILGTFWVILGLFWPLFGPFSAQNGPKMGGLGPKKWSQGVQNGAKMAQK